MPKYTDEDIRNMSKISVTKYRRTRHTFAKSNGLYAMS